MLAKLHRHAEALGRDLFLNARTLADRRVADRARQGGREPRPSHLVTGERGEDLAFFYLREEGYTVVARRWRSSRSRSDLDLVAWDGDTLVIVEVKTRSARDLAPAETAIDSHKRRTLSRLASLYRGRLPQPWRDLVAIRMDVLSVYDLPGGPQFEHIRSAFPLSLWSRNGMEKNGHRLRDPSAFGGV